MRGESLDPGGCSAWPTSACAAASARAPALPPPAPRAPGGAATAAVAIGPPDVADARAASNCAPPVVAEETCGRGASMVLISLIRAIATSTLIVPVDRQRQPRLKRRAGGPKAARPTAMRCLPREL